MKRLRPASVIAVVLSLLSAPAASLGDGLVTIGQDGGDGNPVIAMNHRGDLLVAWAASRQQDLLRVRFKRAGGPWQPVVSLRLPSATEDYVIPAAATLSDSDRGAVRLTTAPVRIILFQPGQLLRVAFPTGHSASNTPTAMVADAAGDVAVSWERLTSTTTKTEQSSIRQAGVAMLERSSDRFGPPQAVSAAVKSVNDLYPIANPPPPLDPVLGIEPWAT